MKIIDAELINTWAQAPITCPAMPTPPAGYDRWHYVGYIPEGNVGRPWGYCFPWDSRWELDLTGQEIASVKAKAHYIIAVRDNDARRSLARLYAAAAKMAHTLSPIDEEIWAALDDAEETLAPADNSGSE